LPALYIHELLESHLQSEVAAATASVTAPPTMRLRETSGKDWVKSAEDGVSVILQSLGGEQISGTVPNVLFWRAACDRGRCGADVFR
jgi:hypothetical protein